MLGAQGVTSRNTGKEPMEDVSVKLSNPDGVPMFLTEKLLEYLVGRRNVLAKFAFGDWLAKLTDLELQHLVDLAGIYLGNEDDDARTDDLAGVAMVGREAEQNRHRVWTPDALNAAWESLIQCPPSELHELLGRVFWAACIEGYRRQEFMEIKGKIRIKPFPGDQALLTDKGLAYGVSIKKGLH
jgi:hypothetical protein